MTPKRLLFPALALTGIAATLARSARSRSGKAPVDDPADVAAAARGYLLYVLLPLWLVPGFGDYLYHRRSKIERTSGTHESLLHSLQMTTIGIPVLLALLAEINALLLAVMAAALVAHESLTIWDVDYAAKLREVTPGEQHCHSFLEVLPFSALSVAICLHPAQALALIGRGDESPRFGLEPKKKPLQPGYIAAILAAVTGCIALPYAEELLRCFRVDRTLRGHAEPIDQGG